MKKLIFILPFLIIALSCRGQSWFPNGFWVGDSTRSGSNIILIDSVTLSATDTVIWGNINGVAIKIGIGATASGGDAYNSGSGITIDGSNNIDLGGALDAATTITGTATNSLTINMVDAASIQQESHLQQVRVLRFQVMIMMTLLVIMGSWVWIMVR
jgi:hypothetical protein